MDANPVHFTETPDQLIELLPTLTGDEVKVLVYMFHRWYAETDIRDICEKTGIEPKPLIVALGALQRRRMIVQAQDVEFPTYRLVFHPAPAPPVLAASAKIEPIVMCQYCGTTTALIYHRDHVVPKSKGGPGSNYNLVSACELCNLRKHDNVWIPRNLDKLTASHPEWREKILSMAVPHE